MGGNEGRKVENRNSRLNNEVKQHSIYNLWGSLDFTVTSMVIRGEKHKQAPSVCWGFKQKAQIKCTLGKGKGKIT